MFEFWINLEGVKGEGWVKVGRTFRTNPPSVSTDTSIRIQKKKKKKTWIDTKWIGIGQGTKGQDPSSQETHFLLPQIDNDFQKGIFQSKLSVGGNRIETNQSNIHFSGLTFLLQ